VQRDNANTSTAIIYYTQAVESVNTIPLANQGITYSFYARKGTNYSAASNVLTSAITTGTGTDQAPYAGYTGSTVPISGSHTLTTTWQRFQVSGSMPNNASEMNIQFTSTPVGTAGAADYFEITGVQIELGAVATSFSRAQGTIQGELAACQRYLPAISGASNSILGWAYATTGSLIYIKLPTTARVAPTGMTVNATLAANYSLINSGFTSGTPTAIAFNTSGQDFASIIITTTAGSPTLVNNQPVEFKTLTSNGYLFFTGCEL
jgi:hypothetical protein